MEEQDQQFFYNGIWALEKRWTKRTSVAGHFIKKWQIICTYLLITTAEN